MVSALISSLIVCLGINTWYLNLQTFYNGSVRDHIDDTIVESKTARAEGYEQGQIPLIPELA